MENSFTDEEVEAFWIRYDDGFKEINRSSPCRQSFSYQEFLIAMKDPGVYRPVLRDDETHEMLALAVWSGNFDHFPWLSHEYFKDRYPEDYAAGRLFYTVATLSLSRREGHMTKIMMEMARQIGEGRGRMLFDLCEDLVAIDWQHVILEASSQVVADPLILEDLGVQRYFSIGFADY